VADKKRAGRSKLIEDAELEALLNEDPRQSQIEFGESLGVARSTISMHLKAWAMIQKKGNWIPYELKPRDLEIYFSTCEQCSNGKNEKVFCIVFTGDEKWIYYDNPNLSVMG